MLLPMASVWHTFQMAGWTAYVCLLLAIIGLPLGLMACVISVARLRAARLVAILVLCFGALAPAVGAVGMLLGRSMVDSALEGEAINPTQRERIREQGYYEAEQALYVGLVCGALPLLLGVVALGTTFIVSARKLDEPGAIA